MPIASEQLISLHDEQEDWECGLKGLPVQRRTMPTMCSLRESDISANVFSDQSRHGIFAIGLIQNEVRAVSLKCKSDGFQQDEQSAGWSSTFGFLAQPRSERHCSGELEQVLQDEQFAA